MATNDDSNSSWFAGALRSDVENTQTLSLGLNNGEDATTANNDPAAQLDNGGKPQGLAPLPSLSKRFRNFPAMPVSTGTSSEQASQNSSQRPSSSDSRSHVPSITSHAFRRPMSSQKLQAHRGHRPTSAVLGYQPPAPEQNFEDFRSNTHRNSTGSAYTIKGGHALPRQDAPAVPPLTSSTFAPFNDGYTEDRTRDHSLAGDFGTQDRGDNFGLLGTTNSRHIPTPLDLEKHALPSTRTSPMAPISPLSFMSGLREKGREVLDRPGGHEKLPSVVTSPGISQKAEQKSEPKLDLGRNWEYATGNSIFFCGGRLQNSRDRPISIATATLVILPACLFFGFSAPWLSSHVSAAIPIIFAYLFFLCMSSFLHASFCDAGIIPRNLNRFPPTRPDEDPLTLGPSTTRWEIVRSATAAKGAMEVPTKYCKSCEIWRPPRCHHCRVCDNCVEAQDHHCVWLNNCVGRRNYRYFLTFVGTATILGIYLMAASIGHIVAWKNQHHTTMGKAINEWHVPFAMFLYGLLAFPYPASLWCYHILLMGWGRTTREYLNSRKFPKKDRHRPFAQATMVQNWIAAMGRPRPPSYLQFKERFQEGDQRFGERRAAKKDAISNQQPTSGMELDQFRESTSAFHPTRLKGLINRTPREKLDYPQLA